MIKSDWSLLSCDAHGLVGGYQHSPETLVTTYKTTWHHNPENHNQQENTQFILTAKSAAVHIKLLLQL